MEELLELYRIIKNTSCNSDQIIGVITEKSNFHCFSNAVLSDQGRDEEAFVRMLQDKWDIHIRCLVCLWHNGTLDLPSMHLRKLLLAADNRNANTKILCQGFDTYVVRTIGKSMPL